MIYADSTGPISFPPRTDRPYIEIFSPRSCKKKMSTTVLGTMDSIGPAKKPAKARPTKKDVKEVDDLDALLWS
jgi:hypothetical protein